VRRRRTPSPRGEPYLFNRSNSVVHPESNVPTPVPPAQGGLQMLLGGSNPKGGYGPVGWGQEPSGEVGPKNNEGNGGVTTFPVR
jgi:hypothetical protein